MDAEGLWEACKTPMGCKSPTRNTQVRVQFCLEEQEAGSRAVCTGHPHVVQTWIQTTGPWGRPLCQILGNSCLQGPSLPAGKLLGGPLTVTQATSTEDAAGSPGGGKGDVQPDGPPGEGPADRFPVHRAGEAPRIQNGRAASPSGGQQPDTSRRSSACTKGRGERRDQRPTEAQPQAPGPHLASQYRLSRRCRNVHGRLWMGGAAPKTGRKDHSLRAWEASSA